jgi:5'-nucleotidase
MNDPRSISPDELGRRTATSGAEFAPAEAGRRLRCLITNDDGIDSPGLHALAAVAERAGLDVVVAAPAANSSGASASITALTDGARIVVQRQSIPGLTGDAFGVQASPAFIALTAARGAFGDAPDLVLSGINHGPNTGQAILHSGTVGAVLTASTQGIKGLAVSLGVGAQGQHWETAAGLAGEVLGGLLRMPAGTVVNLNVPNVPADAVRGLRSAPLAGFGAVQTHIAERGSGYFTVELSEIDVHAEPDSDAALLAAGWATVTALHPVCAASDVDLDLLLGADAVAR